MSLGQRGRIELHIDAVQLLILNGWAWSLQRRNKLGSDRASRRSCRSDPTLPTAKRAQSGMATAGGLMAS